MTEPNGAEKPAEAPASAPRIVIEFAGVGLANMTVVAPGVKLAQLMAAAWLLDSLAREARAGAVAKEAMAGLVEVPGALPPEIARLLHGRH